MTSDKAVLVTGGAGFIGSHYVHSLIKRKNVRVINLDTLAYGKHFETLADIDQNPEHHFVLGSIGDRSLVDYLLKRYQPLTVINFAAQTHSVRPVKASDQFIRTNVLETYELLEATRNYWISLTGSKHDEFRFLQISSDEVYGSLDREEGRSTEDSPLRPNSLYAASKASSDHLVRCCYQTHGMPVLTLRCSNIYGLYQFPGNLIPLSVNHAVHGKRIPVYGKGENIRDWLYVEDLCRAIDQVLEGGRPGGVYNVGGGNERKNIDIVTEMCGILDELRPDSSYCPHSSLIEFVEDRPRHDFRHAMDFAEIRRIGWSPTEPFESGIRKTVSWYLLNQSWSSRFLEKFDSGKGEQAGSEK